jgi:predicted Zn-ribbon and HTH transcriptional regulator
MSQRDQPLQESNGRLVRCVKCGYRFLKDPPRPAISCPCGAMQAAEDA